MIHDYYQKCYEQKDRDNQNSFKPKHKLPPLVGYSPSFCQQTNVYPNKVEMSKFSENTNLFSFKVLWQLLVFLFVHFRLCFRLGLGFSGHCIPLYLILNELIQKHKNVEVNKKEIFIFDDLVKTLKIATDNLEQIIKDIDSEKPDLIYYDNTLPNKYINYIIDYYEKSYNGKGLKANKLNFRPTYKLPPMIAFSPAFVTEKDIYPNKTELSIAFSIYSLLSLNVLWQIIAYLIAHYKFCDTFGFGFMNPLEILKLEPIPKTKFIIITVSPDIHTRSHLYNNKFFKFVGSTINQTKN